MAKQTVCPQCKAVSHGIGKFCMTCGAQMKRKRSPMLVGCLGLFGAIIVLGVLGNLIKDSPPSSSRPSVTKGTLPSTPSPSGSITSPPEKSVRRAPAECLELLSKKGSVDEYSTTITGTIKNNCGRKFRYVQITFKLFDASDNVVGTALANQNDLDVNETWKFKAVSFSVGKTFKLSEITAF